MILLEIKEQVAYVTLNRPDKQNALSYSMFEQLDEIAKKLKKNKSIRLVVIQGQGQHFCSGLDVKAISTQPSSLFKLLFKWLPGNANLAQRMSLNWQMLAMPVIALIEGNCFGGGLHIALGADIRIAHSNTKLAIMEAKWGLCPDMGTGVILPSLLTYDQLLKLSMLATPIDATRALELRLITEISDDIQQSCAQLISQLLQKSPARCCALLAFRDDDSSLLRLFLYCLFLCPHTKSHDHAHFLPLALWSESTNAPNARSPLCRHR